MEILSVHMHPEKSEEILNNPMYFSLYQQNIHNKQSSNRNVTHRPITKGIRTDLGRSDGEIITSQQWRSSVTKSGGAQIFPQK